MVLSLFQVRGYLAIVSNPHRLRVAADPQTLGVEITALWHDLLCEFLILATLFFHDFPPLVFGFGGYAFCICTCWWQMWLLCHQEPLLCHAAKIASDTEAPLIKPPLLLLHSWAALCATLKVQTPVLFMPWPPQCATEILGKQLFHPYLSYIQFTLKLRQGSLWAGVVCNLHLSESCLSPALADWSRTRSGNTTLFL